MGNCEIYCLHTVSLCHLLKRPSFFCWNTLTFCWREYQLTLNVNICLKNVPLLINLDLLESLSKVIRILKLCTRFPALIPGIRTMMKFYAFVMLFSNNNIGYVIKTINLWSWSKTTPQTYMTPFQFHAHLKTTVSLMHSRRECPRIWERCASLLILYGSG